MVKLLASSLKFFQISILFLSYSLFLSGISLGEKKISVENGKEKKIEDQKQIEVNSNQSNYLLQPEAISNHYIVLTGKQFNRYPVSLFLAIKFRSEMASINGMFIQEKKNIGVELIGKIENSKIVLYEIIRKKSEKVVTNNTWTLTKKSNNKWAMTSSQGRINLSEIAPPSHKKFQFRGRDIHPQVISLLFEKIDGSSVAIDIKNFFGRPLKREGEWRRANQEYGYIRYRPLSHHEFSWVLEAEKSEGVDTGTIRKIIYVIWVKGYLSVFRELEQDNIDLPRLEDINVIPVDGLDHNLIEYRKKVNGNNLADYLNRIEHGLFSSKSVENDIKFCDNCHYGLLTFIYDISQDRLAIKSMELVPGNTGSDVKINKNKKNDNNNKVEIAFQETLKYYLDREKTHLLKKDFLDFIEFWLQKIN